jgi:DNA-binding NtrC family response regulator
MANILIIDKNEKLRDRTIHFFTGSGHKIEGVADYKSALDFINKQPLDVIISDIHVPGGDILSLLRFIKERESEIMLIVSSPIEEVSSVIQAIKEGAFDFVRKPFNQGELYVKVEKALEIRRLSLEAQHLRGQQNLIYKTYDVIGESPNFKEVLKIIEKVAKSDSSVMILGETGTGKELIAGLIHYNSLRAGKAFVRVNCAALPDDLLESELFGHEKGAFTGADRMRIGRFEQADGGSIFLDEIADMSLKTQAKVLRVLQEQTFERLGSGRTKQVSVRVISATNKILEDEISAGNFRQDLLYRLNVIRLDLPPLRDRKEDIILLTRFFMLRYSSKMNKKIHKIHIHAKDKLLSYDWPGNIRELENIVERAIIMADEEIGPEDIYLPDSRKTEILPQTDFLIPDKGISLDEVERQVILQALERSDWVQKDAADLLKITGRVLNYKISKHKISHPSWKKNT